MCLQAKTTIQDIYKSEFIRWLVQSINRYFVEDTKYARHCAGCSECRDKSLCVVMEKGLSKMFMQSGQCGGSRGMGCCGVEMRGGGQEAIYGSFYT
jgi:hypothetical protein